MLKKSFICFLVCLLLPIYGAEAAGDATYLWAAKAGTGVWGYETHKGTQAVATDEKAHSGRYSMKLFNNPSSNARIWLEAENLVPGKTYTAKGFVWLTHTMSSDTGARMRVAPSFKSGQSACWAMSQNIKTDVGKWTEVSLSFTQPEDTVYATLLLDAGKIPPGGAVYWDDISLSDYEDLGGEFENVETRQFLKEPEEPVIPDGAENLVHNPGFEEVTGVRPDGWMAYDNDDAYVGYDTRNPYVSLTNEVVHSGSYAVRLTASDTVSNPWTSRTFAVEPLTHYIISAYVNVKSVSGGAVIKFECYDDLKTPCGFFNSEAVSKATDGWVEIRQRIYTVRDCTKIGMLLRLSGSGEIYFDDVAVYKEGEGAAFELSTDGVFYYDDILYGTASSTKLIGKDYTDCTVDYALKDGTTVITARENVRFSDDTAKWIFPLSVLPEIRKEYTLSATLRRSGEVVETRETPVYRYERSPYIRKEDGVYLKNKKEPFYPVIGYQVGFNEYSKMPEAGINVIQIIFSDYEDLRTRLNEAAKYNLMGLVALYSGGNMPCHPDNYETTVDVLSRFKNHPAVFGWMIMDEPFGNYPYHEAVDGLRESYKLIRSIDKEHPVYTLDNQDTTFSESIKYVDILATDPYPGSTHSAAGHVQERIRAAVEAADGQKPVYSILQAFEYFDFWPSDDQMRSMVYQSFMAGAKAVGYFRIGAARTVGGETLPLYRTELWETLHTLSATDIPSFEGFYEAGETECLRYAVLPRGNKTYLAVMSKETSGSVTDSIPEYAVESKVVSGSGEALVEEESILVSLPPCGAMLLEIMDAGASKALSFYEEDTPLLSLAVGTVTTRVKYALPGERLYCALYKTEPEGERLLDIRMRVCTDPEEEVDITVPGSGMTLRAFLWDGISPILMATLSN
ncbi:MAG: hypothetical protein E7390_06760 [Ruminococcaceae bacterium]|nr:hypothetical protein [Oscillospiraceae bacterium]